MRKILGTTIASLALAASAIGLSAGSASASTYIPISLTTSHGVGVYSQATGNSAKYDSDLWASHGDSIVAICWVVGQQVGNDGDVWYKTSQVNYGAYGYSDYFNAPYTAWTFAPYVDGAAAFHNGLNRC
ncbi:hypothetical protein [Streptacidiphilus monticola]|uniref:SH3 domain-containing protein n=1 Tax=Streptacidiphilus monticola TaxID=2161674 RepID=A0ABW1G631_9ACTN